ncbi:MAG: SBBP repeat-containing protein, partial [Nitrososphaerales archaeon]
MSKKWFLGSSVTGAGELNEPSGIAVDSYGNVYVADLTYGRIKKFTGDGKLIATWGFSGMGDSQFNFPHGIAIDSKGNVYVADTDNHRIQKFTSDGKLTAKWGS